MMAAVPKADVVVTNPTHYAVALEYDGEQPGADRRRQRDRTTSRAQIRRIAEEHDIPIVPDPPLARELHRVVEIDQMIPAELYAAVAQVLAFVYQARGAAKKRGRMNEADASARTARTHTDLMAAVAVVTVVTMLVIPLPPFLLDMLITMNISGGLAIVVATMYLEQGARVLGVPEPAAADDDVPTGDQRLGHAADPLDRQRRPRGQARSASSWSAATS